MAQNIIKTLFLIITLGLMGCEALEPEQVGYMSSNMKYEEPELDFIGGLRNVSGPLDLDYSSLPITIEIERVTDAEGKDVSNLFFQPIDVYALKDEITGEENRVELDDKIITIQKPALEINKANGKIILNPKAMEYGIKTGSYSLDIRVTNENSSVLLEKAITFNLKEYKPYVIKNVEFDENLFSDVDIVLIKTKSYDYPKYIPQLGLDMPWLKSKLSLKYFNTSGGIVTPDVKGMNEEGYLPDGSWWKGPCGANQGKGGFETLVTKGNAEMYPKGTDVVFYNVDIPFLKSNTLMKCGIYAKIGQIYAGDPPPGYSNSSFALGPKMDINIYEYGEWLIQIRYVVKEQ